MDKPMFDNPSGNNFIDDFLNEIGPKVGQQSAISLKNEAMIWNLRDILIAKGIVTEKEHDDLLKKKFAHFSKVIDATPRPSPIQPR